jgi:hypothetical protein
MPSPAAYAKAITSAVIAGLTALGVGLTDGALSSAEVVAVALAVAVAFGAVYGVPNAPTDSGDE